MKCKISCFHYIALSQVSLIHTQHILYKKLYWVICWILIFYCFMNSVSLPAPKLAYRWGPNKFITVTEIFTSHKSLKRSQPGIVVTPVITWSIDCQIDRKLLGICDSCTEIYQSAGFLFQLFWAGLFFNDLNLKNR